MKLHVKKSILVIALLSSIAFCACGAEEKKEATQDMECGYTLQECVYEGESQKGNWDVCYPKLESEKLKVGKCNTFITGQIEKALHQIDKEEEMNIYLRYSVKEQTDKVFSILFSGSYVGKEVSHPLNLVFCVNYDLENQKEILLKDIFPDKAEVLKKCKSAIEEQCEEYIINVFAEMPEEDLKKQIFEEEGNFYLEEDKPYLRLEIPASSPYYEFVLLKE